MLWIHIAAGLAAIVFGMLALFVPKGRTVHVRAGRVFGVAMVLMTVSAVLVAAFMRPNPGNVLAGSMTLYLVATGWLAARPQPPRRVLLALAALGLAVAAYGLSIARIAFASPGNAIGGIPGAVMVVFAVIALLAACGDLRLLRLRRPQGAGRILRHLWRMGFALLVAVLSFFVGQADEFPSAVRASGILLLPVGLVSGAVLFFAVRQGWRMLRGPRAGGKRLAPGLPAA